MRAVTLAPHPKMNLICKPAASISPHFIQHESVRTRPRIFMVFFCRCCWCFWGGEGLLFLLLVLGHLEPIVSVLQICIKKVRTWFRPWPRTFTPQKFRTPDLPHRIALFKGFLNMYPPPPPPFLANKRLVQPPLGGRTVFLHREVTFPQILVQENCPMATAHQDHGHPLTSSTSAQGRQW